MTNKPRDLIKHLDALGVSMDNYPAVPLTNAAFKSKLLRRRAFAKASNPLDAPVATGVTMTVDTTLVDAALTSNNRDFPRYRYAGGVPTVYGSGRIFPVASCLPNAGVGNLGAGKNSWYPTIEFETEAPKLTIYINPQAGGYPSRHFRIQVDGQYITKAGTACPGANTYITLDFAGVRAPRRITFEPQQAVVFNGVYITGVDDIWQPRLDSQLIHFAFGDSYTEGQGTGNTLPSYAVTFGKRIGATDTRCVANGGTGYFNAGSNGAVPFRSQIPNHVALNTDINPADVDVVTIVGGYNDYNINNAYTGGVALTPAIMQAEVMATLAVIRATFSKALIIAGGVQSGSRNNDATTLGNENAVAAAVAATISATGDRRMGFIPYSTAIPPYQSGTGKVGATTGAGVNDVDMSADGIHSNDSGYSRQARRMATGYDVVLATLDPVGV
jgi:lysophospholipase L1-like esterase